jgi:hypothetical protein
MGRVLRSIQPLLVFLKLFAFIPFTLAKPKNPKLTFFNAIYVALFTVLWSFSSYQRVFFARGHVVKGSNMSKIAYHMDIIMTYMMCLLLNVGNLVQADEFVRLVELVEDFDMRVRMDFFKKNITAFLNFITTFLNFYEYFSIFINFF